MPLTTVDDAVATIEGMVTTAFPTTVLNLPNSPTTPPVGQLWLSVAVLWGAAMVVTMEPTNMNRVTGVVHMNIYSPIQIGLGPIRRAADTLRGVFNRIEVASGAEEKLRFLAPRGPVGQRRETIGAGIWEVASVEAPFTVEECVV